MNNYLNHLLKPLSVLMIVLILLGCSYELLEAFSGRVLRFSFEAAEAFGLIKDNQATSLYFWEQDYFRIVVHSSFALMIISGIIFFAIVKKFRSFDRAFIIIILLSIVIALNIPFMLYNFLFLAHSPYLVSFIIFLLSAGSILLCSIIIYKLIGYSKNYRNYSIELKTLFINVKKVETIGYFSHNDYTGVIKYSKEEKGLFEEVDGNYIIYVNSYDIKEFEEDFIFKLGYWSYYIDKVVSRYKNKELNYHENAVIHANDLLKDFQEGKKGKYEKN